MNLHKRDTILFATKYGMLTRLNTSNLQVDQSFAKAYFYSLLLKVLLHAGASINDRNTELLTPLDCAACNGQLEAAELLLRNHASVEPMEKHGMTPLLHASVHGHGKMVELLLHYCDISLTDSSGRNCLDLAIDNGRK